MQKRSISLLEKILDSFCDDPARPGRCGSARLAAARIWVCVCVYLFYGRRPWLSTRPAYPFIGQRPPGVKSWVSISKKTDNI